MPRNLELKASVQSVAATRVLAERCGARFHGILLQEDTYFRVTNGRLKLREIAGQGAELIYYERTENALERWSNYVRVAVTESTALKQMLSDALGIRAVVKKRRELYMFNGARIHIDAVEGLGSFLEFEVPVSDESEAVRELRRLRGQFGVTDEAIFTTSYSDLILAKTEGLGS